MNERDSKSPDVVDDLRTAIISVRENNRLEAMRDPSIVDPEIHMGEEELNEFLKTFSEDEKGMQIENWVRLGLSCESIKETDGERIRCTNNAVGSIDWSGVIVSDSILSCREDIRRDYARTMDKIKLQGLDPRVTINGKELPRPEK